MLERLSAHRAWANHLYVEWLISTAVDDAYCLKLLSHVLRSEAAWIARIEGRVPEAVIWETLPPKALGALRAVNEEGWARVLADDTSRRFAYERFDGTPMESSVADIVAHVCTHGMYHRGQIAAQVARADLPRVPISDFIVFARENP